MVLPALIMLVVEIVGASLLVLSAASLRYAVEQAARCYSVNSTQCGSATNVQTYAQNQYHGLNAPTFTASTPACGRQVAASVSILLNAGFARWNVPLSATACFP